MSLDPLTGFTCVTCRLVFKTADLQRDHYKTDWHRYNLKRQVTDLPPVTDVQFREKVLTHNAEKEQQKKVVEDESTTLYCATCKKRMKSANTMENHLQSKAHKEKEAEVNSGIVKKRNRRKKTPPPSSSRLGSAAVVKSTNDVEMKDASEATKGANDEDEDDDSSGWETDNEEEGETDGFELDESQQRKTKELAMEHMRFHHGFALPDPKYLVDHDGLVTYLGLKVGAGRCCLFCPDIRSRFASVEACQTHMRDKAHCKLRNDPESMLEYAEFYDFSPMYNETETANSEDAFDDGWTLTLPSGRKVGHRSLMIFYRQYLSPANGAKRSAGRAALDKARGLYPALAWTGTTGAQSKQVARDLKYVQRYRRRFDLRVASWSHKLFQTRGRVGDN